MSAELAPGELEQVAGLLVGAGEQVAGPLRAGLVSGGRSNLTFVLGDGVARWVLRMPPRTGRTPSAHDVAREYRVTSALSGSDVPVPRAVLLCEDEELLGGPFAVSAFVEGSAIRTRAELDELDDQALAELVSELIGTLAALHAVVPSDVGLASFGRPDGYAERQLRRWTGQWELVGDPGLTGLQTELAARLSASVPEQSAVAVVHGDFRVDNTLVTTQPRPAVAAVVDWELSTLGDPVADVAMMCAYRDPAFDLVVGEPSAWTSARLPSPEALVAGYEPVAGRTVPHWGFHLGLAYYKIAVIAAGIDHRHRAGSGSGAGFDTAGQAVRRFLELGLDTVRRVS